MYQISNLGEKAIYRDSIEQVEISVPRHDCLGIAGILPMPSVKDETDYAYALEHPVSGKTLEQIARDKQAKSACILVSDASRKVPTAKVSSLLVDSLLRAGIAIENIIFIVAIGVHRDATQLEMEEAVGEKYAGRVRIVNHTPYSVDNLIYLGDTSYGTPVEVNRTACQCDLHISVGKVEPHEFAGFSGGRKSVLPGISSERTILANHSPKMLYSDNTISGVLEGNPIHSDMLEAARMFGLDFTVNFVINDNLEPSAVFAGGIAESHKAAVEYLRRYCRVELDKKPDIIVTTPGVPLNLDFYQSMKPLIALADIIDGDTFVALYSACPEGIQSDDMLDPFEKTGSIDEMVEYLLENYKIQMDHSLLLSRILKKCGGIFVYSPNISPKTISRMYMHPCESAQGMIGAAYNLCKKDNPKVLFYPMPQKGLPVHGGHIAETRPYIAR